MECDPSTCGRENASFFSYCGCHVHQRLRQCFDDKPSLELIDYLYVAASRLHVHHKFSLSPEGSSLKTTLSGFCELINAALVLICLPAEKNDLVSAIDPLMELFDDALLHLKVPSMLHYRKQFTSTAVPTVSFLIADMLRGPFSLSQFLQWLPINVNGVNKNACSALSDLTRPLAGLNTEFFTKFVMEHGSFYGPNQYRKRRTILEVCTESQKSYQFKRNERLILDLSPRGIGVQKLITSAKSWYREDQNVATGVRVPEQALAKLSRDQRRGNAILNRADMDFLEHVGTPPGIFTDRHPIKKFLTSSLPLLRLKSVPAGPSVLIVSWKTADKSLHNQYKYGAEKQHHLTEMLNLLGATCVGTVEPPQAAANDDDMSVKILTEIFAHNDHDADCILKTGTLRHNSKFGCVANSLPSVPESGACISHDFNIFFRKWGSLTAHRSAIGLRDGNPSELITKLVECTHVVFDGCFANSPMAVQLLLAATCAGKCCVTEQWVQDSSLKNHMLPVDGYAINNVKSGKEGVMACGDIILFEPNFNSGNNEIWNFITTVADEAFLSAERGHYEDTMERFHSNNCKYDIPNSCTPKNAFLKVFSNLWCVSEEFEQILHNISEQLPEARKQVSEAFTYPLIRIDVAINVNTILICNKPLCAETLAPSIIMDYNHMKDCLNYLFPQSKPTPCPDDDVAIIEQIQTIDERKAREAQKTKDKRRRKKREKKQRQKCKLQALVKLQAAIRGWFTQRGATAFRAGRQPGGWKGPYERHVQSVRDRDPRLFDTLKKLNMLGLYGRLLSCGLTFAYLKKNKGLHYYSKHNLDMNYIQIIQAAIDSDSAQTAQPDVSASNKFFPVLLSDEKWAKKDDSSTAWSSSPLECNICFERFDNENHVPRILNCGHTQCHACVVLGLSGVPFEIIKAYTSTGIHDTKAYTCPQCRKVTFVQNGSATSLTKNFQLTL